MKTLYTDAGYMWQDTNKVLDGQQVMGRICIADNEGYTKVEMAGVGKVPLLQQYINIFELIAIARAIEIAIEKGWVGNLAIHSDSRIAIGWASTGNIKDKKIITEAHRNALEYIRTAKQNYIGIITYTFVPRDHNPAGKVLEVELEKDRAKRASVEPEAKVEPINRGGISFKAECDCGCHTSDSSDEAMKLNGCDICAPIHV